MKKLLSSIIAIVFIFSAAACQQNTPSGDQAVQSPASGDQTTQSQKVSDASFEGKIAIVTNTVSQNEEEYRSAQQVQAKYGADKVVHETWPDNFMTEQEQMISVLSKIAADPEVKVLVLNQAVPGTIAALDKLHETRNDIFVVACVPQENPPDLVPRVNLVLQPDELAMGGSIPVQAQKLGAKVLVHYSFPRHMSQPLLSGRRDLMIKKCAELGIEFVDATAPDPTSDVGVTGAQQFILEDVPKKVAEYGKDTAFFSTNCSMQTPLIKACVDAGAIYPQPCCPSPFHGYPAALGIESVDVGNIQYVIDETKRILDEKGVLGRFSTWPVPVSMMFTNAGADYGVKWIKGEVPKEGIDLAVLDQCMKDYAKKDVSSTALEENSVTYDSYRLIMMDFLTYGEN